MQLNDYRMSSIYDKEKWLNSYKITSGLPYFGGKEFIGKYLMNRICNMAVQMDDDGKTADIFIDVFGGGGKIALSVPEGWFDTIVLNDYNYGITSFYTCCKEQPDELISLIEKLGSVMDKDLFHILAFIRSNDGIKNLDKEYARGVNKLGQTIYETQYLKYKDIVFNDKIDPLLSAAATYWVTKLDFLGITDPLKVSYKASIKDNKTETIDKENEKKLIANAIKNAKTHIIRVSQLMRKNNIIVERLDFAELVKKYNGRLYKTIDKKEEIHSEYAKLNKLWYFDSPYHPCTLNGGTVAPYEDTFDIDLVYKMTQIVHNDRAKEYGEIEYFIKSDYDPKDTYKFALDMKDKYNKEKARLEAKVHGLTETEKKRLHVINEYLNKLEKQIKNITTPVDFGDEKIMPFHHFDCLEDNSEYNVCDEYCLPIAGEKMKPLEQREYFKECLGTFTKGSKNNITGEKVIGKEFIWFRGMKIKDEYKIDNKVKLELRAIVKRKLMGL